MRFALVGDHPDGLSMAGALEASGRHQWAVSSTDSFAQESGLAPRSVPDLEEILADPEIELVIVAGQPADRPAQLRRCLQAERHVLCVHPADDSPDIAYEAAMIQGDTHHLALPLLTDSLHPGVLRLTSLASATTLGKVRLIETQRSMPGHALLDTQTPGHKPSFPGWDVLRLLQGEIAEVSGFAATEEVDDAGPITLAGRFENGTVFQAGFQSESAVEERFIRITGTLGRAELRFVGEGAVLEWPENQESWQAWDPWPTMVAIFESALAQPDAKSLAPVSWASEIRNLELDDAARRSIERRRASTLEYPEASEEVGFKGMMTLVGCGVLWLILFLALLSSWMPWLGWFIIPVLVIFLSLQLLRWVVRRPE
jgi:predicted dehydrogenase